MRGDSEEYGGESKREDGFKSHEKPGSSKTITSKVDVMKKARANRAEKMAERVVARLEAHRIHWI